MRTDADLERLERRVKMHERLTVALILSAVCAVGWCQTRLAPTKTPIEIHLEGPAPSEEQKRQHISERELNQTLAEFEMRERGRLMLSSFAPSVVHGLQDIANAEAFHALYLSDRIEALELKIEDIGGRIDGLSGDSLGSKIDGLRREIDDLSDHVTP